MIVDHIDLTDKNTKTRAKGLMCLGGLAYVTISIQRRGVEPMLVQ